MSHPTSRTREAAHFPAFDREGPISSAPADPSAALSPFRGLVKQLSELYGPSGSEERVRDFVRDALKEFVDQVRVDALGNLIALRRGTGNHRKKVMVAAHMDEIGVMVTFVDSNGYARFGNLGPVKPLTLLGARVQFANGVVGVIGREEQGAERLELDPNQLFVDVGAASASNTPVHVGDAAGLAQRCVNAGELIVGKALNDRVGCAILIETLRRLKKSPHDVYCVFTVQHQVGTRGAGAAAFAIQPDLAFVVETTPAGDTPGAELNGIQLGKGPAIKFKDEALLTSPAARGALLNAAREARVAYQVQVGSAQAGDGTPIQAAREGVLTGALAVPVRYLHTPSEMAHLADVQNAVQLLGALLSKPL